MGEAHQWPSKSFLSRDEGPFKVQREAKFPAASVVDIIFTFKVRKRYVTHAYNPTRACINLSNADPSLWSSFGAFQSTMEY
jgi:hypothetical protein